MKKISIAFALFFALFSVAFAQTSEVCKVCTMVATAAEYVNKYEGWNATTLYNYMYNSCSYLPQQYQTPCDGLMFLYGETIAQDIAADKPAKKVCFDVGVCNTTSIVGKAAFGAPKEAKEDCSSCQKLITTLEQAVKKTEDADEDSIESMVVSACKSLKNNKKCIDNSDKVVGDIKRQENPAKVCKKLEVC
eukprot:TRINITY_DN15460_c0_g1_i1.p1 TRINITY_DN15460_c0_g1~~TRINITY_DN15460_c0_g1_i1.p1  ORF type:complete len:216 (-),score=58.33 TRINITY_DN15460_c0_g1_i1:107-679(-)